MSLFSHIHNIQPVHQINIQKKRFDSVSSIIPYGHQWIEEEDIEAVINALRSDWLTTGPRVSEFEQLVANAVDAAYGVAVNSGTAALHCAMHAIGIQPGDEVIVPSMTFAATANSVVSQGGKPVFADVNPENLLIDPCDIEKKINKNTKALISVDYAGHPCDYDTLKTICRKHHLFLIADACHALGAEYRNQKVGSLADLTVFSFHPVKHITTGEGGMVTTNNADYYHHIKTFINHGITTDHHQREQQGSWFYEMVDLGFNYRISDILCALGISQMKKLPQFLNRRRQIASMYDSALNEIRGISPLTVHKDVRHAYHLYVVRIDKEKTGIDRNTVYYRLRDQGIHTNVHYIPVHLHPYYQKTFHTAYGDCPITENAHEEILSLPIYPKMSDSDVERVILELENIFI
jgi:perosamine synthetase